MVYIRSLTSTLAFFTLIISIVSAGKTCTVATGGDASTAITNAFKSCANGGTVVFTKGATYNMKSLISITGLKNVHVQFYGNVNLPSYNTKYNGKSAYLFIKGDNVYWDGGSIGKFNGGGQKWWDAKNHKAPTVLRITATNSVFRNFQILSAPRAHVGVTSSSNLVLEKVYMHSVSSSSNLAKNTDALDISNTHNFVFRDSNITPGDDCTAINGGVSNVTISNIQCTNGHGFSVGSLGKNGATDYVKGVYVTGSTCTNCQNGLRIKTWPGGKGSVDNIKFHNNKLVNTKNPILITTHYCDNNQMQYCNNNDNESLWIKDITLSAITGSVSKDGKPIISINCSKNTPCKNFSLSGINISKNSKTKSNICNYLDGSSKISYCK